MRMIWRRRGGPVRRVSRWMSRRSGRRGRPAISAEVLGAGFWPRAGAGPGPRTILRSRSGFGSGDDLDELAPGPALAGLADTATRPGRIAGLDDDELIGALRAWRRLESWTAAGTLAVAAELARRRPADRAPAAAPGQFPDQPSEFVADEIAAALTLTGPAAGTCLDLAMDLAIRLPGTAAALRAGIIDYLRARIIAEATRILSGQDARQAEDRILPGAGQQTSGQLRAALARTILAIDPAAAQRRREQAQKDPRIRRWREDAGTAALAGYGLPPADVLEADQHLTDRALHLREAGQPGTLDELRARAYLDALLGRHPAAPTPAGEPAAPGQAGQPAATRRTGRTRRRPPAPAVWSIGWPRPVHRRRAAQCATAPPAPDPGPHPHRPRRAAHRSPAPAAPCSPPHPAGRQTPGEPGAPGQPTAASPAPAPPGPAAPTAFGGRLAARINLTVPLTTLLGLPGGPGDIGGFGPIDPALARDITARAAAHPSTSWSLTITHTGQAIAHGPIPARRARRFLSHPRGPHDGGPGDGGPDDGGPHDGGPGHRPPGQPGPAGRPPTCQPHRQRRPAGPRQLRPPHRGIPLPARTAAGNLIPGPHHHLLGPRLPPPRRPLRPRPTPSPTTTQAAPVNATWPHCAATTTVASTPKDGGWNRSHPASCAGPPPPGRHYTTTPTTY